MKLLKIYCAVLTKDLARAESWYSKLLGRGPDNRPMNSLVQWELFDGSGLALSTDTEIAGKGMIFLYVEDINAERNRLKELDIVIGENIQGDYSTLSQVSDLDGNLITLATPPLQPFPPA